MNARGHDTDDSDRAPDPRGSEHDDSLADPHKTTEVVRTLRLEIVDREERVRAVVGDLESPDDRHAVYGLSIIDTGGHERISVALPVEGPSLVFDLGGNIVAQVGVNDPRDDAVHVGAYLVLARPDGTPALVCRVEEDGSVTVERADGRADTQDL